MNLAKYERETIIRYNEEESEAVIDTCHRKLINKLDRLGAKVIHQDNYGKRYVIPESWIKVSPPRKISEEQRQKCSKMRLSKNG